MIQYYQSSFRSQNSLPDSIHSFSSQWYVINLNPNLKVKTNLSPPNFSKIKLSISDTLRLNPLSLTCVFIKPKWFSFLPSSTERQILNQIDSKKSVRVIFSDYCISFYHRVSTLATMPTIMSIERPATSTISSRAFPVAWLCHLIDPEHWANISIM